MTGPETLTQSVVLFLLSPVSVKLENMACYAMKDKDRGFAVIINNFKFKSPKLDRLGAEKDSGRNHSYVYTCSSVTIHTKVISQNFENET